MPWFKFGNYSNLPSVGPLPNGPFMIFYGLYMWVSKHLAMHLVSFIVLFVYVFLWENAASDDK